MSTHPCLTEPLLCTSPAAPHPCSGTIPKLPANLLLVKNLTAHGIYWWVLLLPLKSPMVCSEANWFDVGDCTASAGGCCSLRNL